MSENPVADVDLGVLARNLAYVRTHVAPEVMTMAMVKANAYGHGLPEVAHRLAAEGTQWFGVATPDEARAVRAAASAAGVLLLIPVRDRAVITELCDLGVALVATDEASVDRYLAADLPRKLRLHLKVDTGMGRLGLPWTATASVARRIAAAAQLELQGVWTHFSDSDEESRAATLAQVEAFESALDELARDGLQAPIRHAANSAAILAYPEAHYDMVRPGIVLYGYHSSDHVAAMEPRVAPVMRLRAPITFVKRVAAGTSVSYGRLWQAPHDTTLASLRMGYADGYPRALTGKGWASVNGERCPVVGRVCMDQMLLDVGAAGPVGPGDAATLWGGDGPDAEDLARAVGTVSYELLTGLMPRVERNYLG